METKILDLMAVSESYGVEFEEIQIPDGRIAKHPHWTADTFAQFQEVLNACRRQPDVEYLVANPPEPWITVAAINGLRGLDVKYQYGPSQLEMTKMEFMSAGVLLPAEENLDAQFIVEDDGQRVYMEMTTDTWDTKIIHGHTFNIPDYYKVKLPALPAGRDIYLHSWGTYSVMCCAALTYIEDCRSLWLACHETDYFCAYSSVADYRPGDVEKRTRENPLPH